MIDLIAGGRRCRPVICGFLGLGDKGLPPLAAFTVDTTKKQLVLMPTKRFLTSARL